jgi:hypothetical protein
MEKYTIEIDDDWIKNLADQCVKYEMFKDHYQKIYEAVRSARKVQKVTKTKVPEPKVTRSKDPKKVTKTKDIAPPKSAYLFFASKRRPIIKKELPSLSFEEITKILHKEWRNISPSKAEIYIKESNKDKIRFEKDTLKLKLLNLDIEKLKRISAENGIDTSGKILSPIVIKQAILERLNSYIDLHGKFKRDI